uniref:Ubiquitin-like domain-containing protein n=1 Tax=Taeniopygia guttata TaxID=59729 RepID=A0A674HIT2_TAEGU
MEFFLGKLHAKNFVLEVQAGDTLSNVAAQVPDIKGKPPEQEVLISAG